MENVIDIKNGRSINVRKSGQSPLRFWGNGTSPQRHEMHEMAGDDKEEIIEPLPFLVGFLESLRSTKQSVLVEPFLRIRNYFYRREADRLLVELVALARKLNRPNFHVFIDVAGHVDRVCIRVFPHGWGEDAEMIKIWDATLPGYRSYAPKTPNDMRNVAKQIVYLSRIEELNPA